MNVREALAKLVLGENLSRDEAESAMRTLVEGEATPIQIGAFAIAYADQTERDYKALAAAVKSGRIQAETGL